MILEVKDIAVNYGSVAAVQCVSLEVERNSMVALVGANGAGKTTTLRTISGLLKPAAGEIWFDGQRIDGKEPHKIVRLGIAHVPEGKRLFAELTVLENLKMGAYTRKDKEIEQDLKRIYTYFPILSDRSHQQSGSLSGGEQQMLAMGRALMARPKLLLLDEPSEGLAPIMVQQVANIINEIRRAEGMSILLVEQNASLALQLAEKAFVLETGCVCLSGECSAMIDDPKMREAYLGG